jgi:hypothetical protein
MKAKRFAVNPVRPANNERRGKRWYQEKIATLKDLRDTQEFVVRFQELLAVHVYAFIVQTKISLAKSLMMRQA